MSSSCNGLVSTVMPAGDQQAMCPGPESNRHGRLRPADFKSAASTSFATWAQVAPTLPQESVLDRRDGRAIALQDHPRRRLHDARRLAAQGSGRDLHAAAGVEASKTALELGGGSRTRTGIDGFAGRCITLLPSRLTTDKKGKAHVRIGPSLSNLERETSLELATSTLARLRSTN